MTNPIYRTLKSAMAQFDKAERRHRDLQALSNMSDYELSDIGLTRTDIRRAMRTGQRSPL